MTEQKIYSLCEAVADIAFIAGENGYYSGDSRKDIADFIAWAKEFESMYDADTWHSEDYIDAIQSFADKKLNKDAEP